MNKAITLFIFALLLALAHSNNAIVTYHLYKRTDSLSTVACSDGANGLMSWGYKDLSMVFPYVTAWQPASWNSPQCGSCAKITWNGKFTYVTVIDQCGVINSAYSHFDMSREAFYGLFGDIGIAKGTMLANFTIVASSYCPGNKKGVKSGLPFPWVNQHRYPQHGQQQNLKSQTSEQKTNPLWVKGNKSSDSHQFSGQTVQQQSAKSQNPLWVKGGNDASSSFSEKTIYGGHSYDQQNEKSERGGN